MKKLETTSFSLFPFIFIFEILVCEEKEEGKKEKKDFFLFPFSFPDFFMFFFWWVCEENKGGEQGNLFIF